MTPEKTEPKRNGTAPSAAPETGGSSFPATQWSLVLRAGGIGEIQSRSALEALCRRYWHPLYAFVRRQGREHHEAEDCTQDFIAQLLAADGLRNVQAERGRFRTFLLTGMRNFLTSEWRRNQALKRGGGLSAIPIGPSGPGESFAQEPIDPGLSPEQTFDRCWALDLIDRAVHTLRTEYESSGRAKVFAAMAPLIWGTDQHDLLVRHATDLGLTVNSFTVALHRARRRLGERLRAEVAETVIDPAEIDGELRYLVEAINGAPPRG
jgi:RNA polymerase sigma factor (sigma-70 family)